MSREEIALELTKLVSDQVLRVAKDTLTPPRDYAKAIADAYNTILSTIHPDNANNTNGN